MTLEDLRNQAIFQNTVDIWIMLCEENNQDWTMPSKYIEFIKFLEEKDLKLQKFPLCVKESGGTFERNRQKAKFLDDLSQISDEKAGAYILKLNASTLSTIRSFLRKIKD